MKKQNPPETLQSLLKYEYKPGQMQKFLEYLRRYVFIKITDVDLEFEDEVRFNIIFFYNALDKGEFTGHKNEWVTVNNQKVIKYGEKYSDDQLNHVLETMPNAIQLLVDRTRLPRSKPAKMVIAQCTNSGDDYKNTWEEGMGYNYNDSWGYGTPAEQIHASMMFEVSIVDDNNWSKWVQAKILLWR
ncbi:hypothetical protein Glove_34g41 [Diversispora epigaea]|uniref:Uncharacterized protein n=1 Tax=Diversispora epigaea TaxID=1348612 RepID=A0A397JHC3_9GLOM|nr:hypothetical protein Glove_34g41 [Diversispora epigaea]